MTSRIARGLKLKPKMLIVAAGACAAFGLVVVYKLNAQSSAPPAQAVPAKSTAPQKGAATHPPGKPVVFDAASVKPIAAAAVVAGRKGGRGSGGPGTADPGRIHYAAIRLKVLVINAYGVKDFQIVGPDWLNDDGEATRFAIDATMPPDTTREQLRLMFQNLLADRFKLEIHRETRDLPKYSLIVTKNGPKMKESAESQPPGTPATSPSRGGPGRESLDKYGFPIYPRRPEGGTWTLLINGRGRLGGDRATMQDLVNALMSSHLPGFVTDDTGLKAKYDFILTYSTPRFPEPVDADLLPWMVNPPELSEPLPDLFAAMESQLGLKLQAKKGPVDVIVIDHIEKRPTEN
jgi:uncharacterized protein (TIGR03435 family)